MMTWPVIGGLAVVLAILAVAVTHPFLFLFLLFAWYVWKGARFALRFFFEGFFIGEGIKAGGALKPLQHRPLHGLGLQGASSPALK
jgi:hypothetical protein